MKSEGKTQTDLLDGNDLLGVIVHPFVDGTKATRAELLEDGVLRRWVVIRHHRSDYRRRRRGCADVDVAPELRLTVSGEVADVVGYLRRSGSMRRGGGRASEHAGLEPCQKV